MKKGLVLLFVMSAALGLGMALNTKKRSARKTV